MELFRRENLKVLTISEFLSRQSQNRHTKHEMLNNKLHLKCSISQFSLREEEDFSIFRINHDVFTVANSQRQNNVICQEEEVKSYECCSPKLNGQFMITGL